MKNNLFVIFFHLAAVMQAQMILNGDFENHSAVSDQINLSNDACNKTLYDVHSFGTYGDVDVINSATYGNGGAQHGKWYVGLTGGGTDIIAMTLSTPLAAGKTYSLSYWDRKTSGYNVYPLQIGVSSSNGSIGTIVHTSAEPAQLDKWTQHSFTFVAPSDGRYLTVQMSAGSISDWVNVDNFMLHPSRCQNDIRILSSHTSIEKGGSVTFTVENVSVYHWEQTNLISKGDNIFETNPKSSTIYTVTSQQKNCPAISATVEVAVIEPKPSRDTIINVVVKKDEPLEQKTVVHKKGLFGKHRVNGRRFKIQETVTVSNSEIKLMVWDKNKVDGDRVSLFLNGELLEKELAVSKVKKEITLSLLPGKNIIVMYAINLGTIPPNTAIMRINNGARPKLITLVSDLKKSGALEIIYDPVAFSGK